MPLKAEPTKEGEELLLHKNPRLLKNLSVFSLNPAVSHLFHSFFMLINHLNWIMYTVAIKC